MEDDERGQAFRRFAAAARYAAGDLEEAADPAFAQDAAIHLLELLHQDLADVLQKAEEAARWTGMVSLARANGVGSDVLAQLETTEGAKREALSLAMNEVMELRYDDLVPLLRTYAKLASIASGDAADEEVPIP